LYDSPLTSDLKHLALSDGSIAQTNVDDFGVFRELDIIQNDQWAIDFNDSSVINSWRYIIISSHSLEIGVEKVAFVHVIWIFLSNYYWEYQTNFYRNLVVLQ
jgi:hypothetical protein